MPYIYKIENKINNKVYIGKTLYTIQRRWKQHKDNSTKEYLKHLPLYAAMQFYGINNFEISEVEEVKDFNILSEREQYWIKYYDSYNKGYNCTLGGDGSLLYDYDLIWNLWKDGKSIKEISNEIKCNDYVVRTVLDIHNVTTEERIERSIDKQKESHLQYQREIFKININDNKILKIYPSVSEAARENNCDESYLSKICKNKQIFLGYKWEYSNKNYVIKDFSSKSVYQINLKTGEIINKYSSISEAARAVNGDSSYISKVCRGIQHSSKGYGWRYANKGETNVHI